MRNIIFDFDGTIADSFDYVFKFLSAEAGHLDLSKIDVNSYRYMSMKSIALQLGIPFWRLPFLYFKGRRVMREHLLHIQPFPGMPGVIRSLHQEGNVLNIISSNSRRNVRFFLRHHNLDDCFQVVRGGAGYMGKVWPLRQLKRRFKTDDCWYIGDEITDIVSAKTAGVHNIAVTWGFASKHELSLLAPTYIVETPPELHTILG